MYKIKQTTTFKKDIKQLPRTCKIEMQEVVDILEIEGILPDEYQTHVLTHDFSGVYDSHLDDDIIILWRKKGKSITLLRIGTHTDLF